MEEGGAIDGLLRGFVPGTYVQQGLQALGKRHALFRHLLEHKRLPEVGWDEPSIEYIVNELALMDRYVWLETRRRIIHHGLYASCCDDMNPPLLCVVMCVGLLSLPVTAATTSLIMLVWGRGRPVSFAP